MTVKTKLRPSSGLGFETLIKVILSIFRVVANVIICSLFIELGMLLMGMGEVSALLLGPQIPSKIKTEKGQCEGKMRLQQKGGQNGG